MATDFPLKITVMPSSGTSIPAMLTSMRDEFDAMRLHADRQSQEIARLTRELAATREALATLETQAGVAPAPHAAQQPAAVEPASAASGVEQTGMSAAVVARLQDWARALTESRERFCPRSKPLPSRLMSSLIMLASHPRFDAPSARILSMDINPSDDSKILMGSQDCNATVFNKDTGLVVAILEGHTREVTRVIYHRNEDTVITASPDSSIRVWHVPTSQTTVLLRAHDGPVTGLALHTTGDYVLSTSTDQHWAFSDIRTGQLLTKVSSGVPLTTAQFHPDGLIFGTGTEDSNVKIWDLKEQRIFANFGGHVGPITSISFSKNGNYLATAADDACVKLWDLRKLKKFRTIQLAEGYQIKDLCFNQSDTYLGMAGTDVRVYLCKRWQVVRVFNDHTALATGIRFGRNAQYIASTSMDRTLKLYDIE